MKNSICGLVLAALSCLVFSCSSQLDEDVFNASDAGNDNNNCTSLAVRSLKARSFGATAGSDEGVYSFLEGDSIRLHASGALDVENGWLVYQRGHWINAEDYLWSEENDSAHVVLIYPGMQRYDTSTLYDEDGRLMDVMYWDDVVPAFKAMIPCLVHRFSQLVINIDENMAPLIQSVGIEIKAVVTAMDAHTVALVLDDTQSMTSESEVENHSVKFIVPSECQPDIFVTFFFNDGSQYSQGLEIDRPFEVNHSYYVMYH